MPSMNLQYSDPATAVTDAAASVVGFSPYIRYASPEFRVGSVCYTDLGKEWAFGKATAAIAVATPASGKPTPTNCAFTPSTGVIAAGSGYKAHAAFAVGEYGWIEKA